MDINIKEAKTKIGALLDRSQKGEEVIIMRRGKRIAKLVPVDDTDKRLPDLRAFRNSIAVKGELVSTTVIQGRNEERY